MSDYPTWWPKAKPETSKYDITLANDVGYNVALEDCWEALYGNLEVRDYGRDGQEVMLKPEIQEELRDLLWKLKEAS